LKLLPRSKGYDSFTRNHIGFDFFAGNQESLSFRIFVNAEIHKPPGDVFDKVHVALDGQQIALDRLRRGDVLN
jgi:hypothetical protein